MFNDEERIAFKMHEYSPVDGFVEINECLAEMIKFVANEPSVGLFYIQQHTQNAVPNLINLKTNIVEKSHEMALHTEDSEDSITMMRSMKECGFPIADEMIREIKTSLSVMSSKQPKRGLITSSSWTPAMWSGNISFGQQDDGASRDGSSGYFSNVFRSAKKTASKNFNWPQSEPTEPNLVKGKAVLLPDRSLPAASATDFSTIPEAEGEELPISSQLADLPQDKQVGGSMSYQELFSLSENYEVFKADREAKLEEWLGGTDDEALDGERTQQ